MTLEQLVTFAILMESGGGILNKSPDYILEKFEACSQFNSVPFLRTLLDKASQAKFDTWMRKWGLATTAR